MQGSFNPYERQKNLIALEACKLLKDIKYVMNEYIKQRQTH